MNTWSEVDILFDLRSTTAEGPLWLEEAEQISFVDVPAGLVHVGSMDGSVSRTIDVGQHVGAAMPAAGGGFLLARRDGFVHLLESGAQVPIDLPLATRPEMRFNDGKCDPKGRAWAGTMPYQKLEAAGELYRLSASGHAESIVGSITVSNGMGWSPDGGTMYYIDSRSRKLYAFDYDLASGTASGQSLFIDFSTSRGAPDGLAVDDEGCLWVAMWGGWEVRRFSSQGAEIGGVQLPVAKVTSCCFVDDVLVITTASAGLDAEEQSEQPLAGAVFAHRAGVGAPGAVPWSGLEKAG